MSNSSQPRYQPLSPLVVPRFGGITTFSRLPYVPDFIKDQVDVAILGIPYDGGTSYRPGARFAPRAIREASVLCRNFNPNLDVDIYQELKIVDAGDVAVNPINIQATYQAIEEHLAKIHATGARTICMGGDHSVLLPGLREAAKRYGPLTLIHFDAHNDTGDSAWGERYHHGTPIRRAIEEGLVQGSRIFQIGIRGPLTAADQNDYIKAQQIQVLGVESFADRALRELFIQKIRRTAGQGPCYITFDIDSVDPAFAPGTGTPVVGGLTSADALQCVRALKGLKIVGADLVEISPPYDHAEITALLGAALVFEFLSLMALSRD